MTYPCELIELLAQPVLAVRTRAAVQDLPAALGKGFEDVMAVLAEQGQAPAGAPYVAYHNQDMQDLDLEIGFPVAGNPWGKGAVTPGSIPACRAVACMFTGPYDQIEAAYNDLMAFAAQQGVEMSGVGYEFYLNDPETTPPQDLLTRIVFPLN